MKRLLSIMTILVLLLTTGCQKQLSEEEAFNLVFNFVNQNMQVGVDDSQGVLNPDEVKISLVDIEKADKEWQVKMLISSNSTGEVKRKGLIVVVDAKTGEIDPTKIMQVEV